MCELLLRHNGRPLIRQKHEMIRKCLMSDCYFSLWYFLIIRTCILITQVSGTALQSIISPLSCLYLVSNRDECFCCTGTSENVEAVLSSKALPLLVRGIYSRSLKKLPYNVLFKTSPLQRYDHSLNNGGMALLSQRSLLKRHTHCIVIQKWNLHTVALASPGGLVIEYYVLIVYYVK